jgi:hypothetical protein
MVFRLLNSLTIRTKIDTHHFPLLMFFFTLSSFVLLPLPFVFLFQPRLDLWKQTETVEILTGPPTCYKSGQFDSL